MQNLASKKGVQSEMRGQNPKLNVSKAESDENPLEDSSEREPEPSGAMVTEDSR
jgi:hypothetical protein